MCIQLIAWWFPLDSIESITDQSIDDLKEKYKARDRIGNILFPVLFLVLAVIYWILLETDRSYVHGRWESSIFFLATPRLVFAILSLFMSLASSYFVAFKICRWLLGPDEWKVYSIYACYRAFPRFPFDMIKFFNAAFWLGFPLLIALDLVLVDHFTAFTDVAVIYNSPLSLGEEVEHLYANVTAIYEIRGYHLRGEYRIFPYELILFDDGTSWASDKGTGGSRLDELRKIMEFVAEKSGKKYMEIQSIEAMPK